MTCTSRGLLELLALLLPPFPGLEEASQSGKLAPTTDGWRVGARDQGLRTHYGQPLYLLSCKEKKINSRSSLGEDAEEVIFSVILQKSNAADTPSSVNLCQVASQIL